jgi:hypothetical protein
MPACFGRCTLLLLACLPAAAQTSAPAPLKIGDIAVSGSLRTRVESWDWFGGNANNEYTYPGSILRVNLSESRKAFDWQVEFALPFLLGLPDDAIAPSAQGQFGFGASYFAANGRKTNAAMLFAKQGYIRFNAHLGLDKQCPISRQVSSIGRIIEIPQLGGLHHRYERVAA